jgi:hypothetical protein
LKDKAGRPCTAQFSLDPARPLITSIAVNGKTVISRAQPVYRGATGKRRGGFDQFFDFPPSHPEGTRNFLGVFKMTAAHAKFEGDRLDISFDGLQLGIFRGNIHYIFFPGSTLIQQRAIVSTNEPDTAFYYDAGIRMTADEDRRSGGTMETNVNYYDTTASCKPCALPMLRSGIRWPPDTARFPPRPGPEAWQCSRHRTGISWLAITPVTWDIFGTRPGGAACR